MKMSESNLGNKKQVYKVFKNFRGRILKTFKSAGTDLAAGVGPVAVFYENNDICYQQTT